MTLVDGNLPMTSRRCGEIMEELKEICPGIRLETIGVTAFGRPLLAMVMGRGDRRVLYTAAHHANEWLTTAVLLKFAQELASGETLAGVPAEALLEEASISLVPMVDPDGVDLVTGAIGPDSPEYRRAKLLSDRYPEIPFPEGWKANLLGVDLNLQYPAGWLQAREIKFSQGYTKPGPRDYVGRAPLGQREARALADYTEQVDPELVLAYHSQGQVIYWQFRDYADEKAKALGEEFARLSGYVLADTPYESAFAGYKDWFLQEFRRPGYTIEVGTGENPLPAEQFPEIYEANRGILVRAALGLN